ADPRRYELWYVYATGKNQKLRDEIDAALPSDGRLTESDIARLHAQFISPTRNADDLDRAANRLNDQVGQFVQILNPPLSAVGRYDEQLNEGTAAASTATNEADLRRVIEDLITATFSMERENSSLKEQLEASRVRSEKLMQEIEAVRVESLTDALTQVGNRQHFDDTL